MGKQHYKTEFYPALFNNLTIYLRRAGRVIVILEHEEVNVFLSTAIFRFYCRGISPFYDFICRLKIPTRFPLLQVKLAECQLVKLTRRFNFQFIKKRQLKIHSERTCNL